MKPEKNTSKLKSYKYRRNIDTTHLWMLALPGMLLTLIFHYLPMAGIVLAFKEFNPNLGIFGSKWIGFDNFTFFFTSNNFLKLTRNTLGYNFAFIVIGNMAAIAFALLCYNIRNRIALKYYQTTSILPTFMSMVLVSYIVYTMLSPTNGVINKVIGFFGGEGIDWYAKAGWWPLILTIVKVWYGTGYGSLLYYATMVGIDESLFEAADIDGAKRWDKVRYIIIPELSSLICLQIIMGVGNAMGGDIGLFYQVPRNVGLLYDTTDIYNTYVFRALQTGDSMGRTTAIGLFQSVSGIILLLISNTIIKKINSENSMF